MEIIRETIRDRTATYTNKSNSRVCDCRGSSLRYRRLRESVCICRRTAPPSLRIIKREQREIGRDTTRWVRARVVDLRSRVYIRITPVRHRCTPKTIRGTRENLAEIAECAKCSGPCLNALNFALIKSHG